ncbi:AMP-binding protein [Candidatus Coxiella mudrowiae]|uniref:AMP-binding protein n=1 Tax=Candidatus Coxiella mudrowiae TaxID=2054173 RepID=UPI000C28CAC8|nr:AMP-binding protein [Candidatus Coxiella mudrowiae]
MLQFLIAMFCALRSGVVVVNCNPLYTEREFDFQLKDDDVTELIVLENFANVLSSALGKVDLKHIIVTKWVIAFSGKALLLFSFKIYKENGTIVG